MALVSWFVPEGFFWCCERACVHVQIWCEVSTWACKARKQTGKKQRDWKAARELQQSTAARVGRKEELYDTKCCTNCMTCPSLLNPPPVRPLGFSLWDAGLRRKQSGDHDASAKRVAQCLGSLPWHHKRPKATTFLVSAWQRTPSAWALELDSCHVRRSHNIMAGVKVIIVRWMSLFPPTQPIIMLLENFQVPSLSLSNNCINLDQRLQTPPNAPQHHDIPPATAVVAEARPGGQSGGSKPWHSSEHPKI